MSCLEEEANHLFFAGCLGELNNSISDAKEILSMTFKYMEGKHLFHFLLEILPLIFLFTQM